MDLVGRFGKTNDGVSYSVFSDTVKELPDDGFDICKGKSPEQWLQDKYLGGPGSFGVDHLVRDGVFLLLGLRYDFKPFLKKYLVGDRDRHTYRLVYAPSVAALRKACHIPKYTKVFKVCKGM